MRRSTSVTRPALLRKAIVGLLATFVSIALLPCGVAAADTVTTNFDNFNLGTVNGQGSVNGQPGWKTGSTPNCFPHGYDEAVVNNPGVTGFGTKSLRMSNLYGCNEFTDQTYSAPVASPAGEHLANTEYIAQFSFITTTPEPQTGLFMSVSPDSYEGSRMSYVGLEDTSVGTLVFVSDTPGVDGEFVDHAVALLPRGVPHTIKFWIKLNPGPNNDLVRLSIDGVDTGQCFATWENYYSTSPEQAPPPNVNHPATISSLQFRTSVAGPPELAGGGYLFDNVSVTTSNGAGPPGCDLPIEKQADSPTVSAGGHAGYRITVRNRGRLSARDVQVCDQIPAHMTFVSADRKLLPRGSQRCLLIPRLAPGQRVSFHLVLHVDANAPPGTEENIAIETPVAPPGVPPAPPASLPDLPGKTAPIPPAKEAKTSVKVRATRTARRPPAPPPVTG